MIFVTLGSQKFQMNRLLLGLDDLKKKKKIDESIFAQIGFSDYQPKNFDFEKFLNKDEFQNVMEQADIVISHGGTGAIVGALKMGKKVIAVPRKSEFGEHVDDHQLEIVDTFEKLNLVMAVDDMKYLEQAIEKIKKIQMETFHSTNKKMIQEIRKEIENWKIRK